ncbi:MAG: ZIP family metal transporter [Crocinitomicaceae bacterium]|nr:ZIP family metal transporter [Crocinitomicaceae bacterium]
MSFLSIQITLILSVLFGGLMVSYLKSQQKAKTIKLTLAFSGGFLLAIIFQHLLPDLYQHDFHQAGLFILLGFLVQLILEYFSGGIEHGHTHSQANNRIPFTLFVALSIHSVIEGFPLGNSHGGHLSHVGHDHETLFWGIVFHQIPVAIALMTLFVNSKMGMFKSWVFLIIFALTTPLGAILGTQINLEDLGLNIHVILAVVVGMFLHISTTIIFETSENHRVNLLKLVCILLGAGLSMLLS